MPTETLLRISFSVIGRCSLVPSSHWLQGKCARINLSQAAFGRILGFYRITGNFLYALLVPKITALESLIGLLEVFSNW